MKIISLTNTYRAEVDQYTHDEWGGPKMVTLGNMFDLSTLPGYVSIEDDTLIGAVLFRLTGDECEMAALFALFPNRGAGTALTNRVIDFAKEYGCRRLWLVTTNDNTNAIRFYQKRGFALKAVHIGSFEVTRRMKNELPSEGNDGIPIEHEFEFEMLLR